MYWTDIQRNPMCTGLLYKGIQCVVDCHTGEFNVYWTVIQRNPKCTVLLYRKNMCSSVIGRNAM